MSGRIAGRNISGWRFELIKRLCRQQRLATEQQREKFLLSQRFAVQKRMVSDAIKRRQLIEAAAKICNIKDRQQLRRVASDFLKLESLRAPEGPRIIGGKICRGKYFRPRGSIAHIIENALPNPNRYQSEKKRLSHERRLAKWKAQRDASQTQ